MAEGQDTARNIISVTVKSTKDKKTVEIAEDADIKEVMFFPKRVPHHPVPTYTWLSEPRLPPVGQSVSPK